MPRPPLTPITIATVGDLIDNDIRMHAECRACQHKAWVDLDTVAERVGRDHSYLRGNLKLTCSACGSRDIASVIIPSR